MSRVSQLVARASARATVAAVLVGLNALYICLVAFGNITDYASNQAFVQHVLSMDTTNFGGAVGVGLDARVTWRAVTNPWLQNTAYLTIIAWETATGVVLAVATARWIIDRRHACRQAQDLSTLGLVMIVALFAGGFLSIGGEWFAMYRSTSWNGLDPAFRNSVLALVTLILIHLPQRASPPNATAGSHP